MHVQDGLRRSEKLIDRPAATPDHDSEITGRAISSSLEDAFSVAAWNRYALGMWLGLLRRRADPSDWIESATLPLPSCQRMSLLPSPLKSPVPAIDQGVAALPTPED
jgi:hypothetical protein